MTSTDRRSALPATGNAEQERTCRDCPASLDGSPSHWHSCPSCYRSGRWRSPRAKLAALPGQMSIYDVALAAAGTFSEYLAYEDARRRGAA